MLARAGDARIGRTRWVTAQKYERDYWQRLHAGIEAGTRDRLGWYRWRASQLEQRLTAAGEGGARKGAALEIGSGPVGIVGFLSWSERYAIDPLELFYRGRPSLVELRQPGTRHLSGTGEELPFDDSSCGLVIIDNVIDHTYSPGMILREVRRVLRPDGRLYLSVNVHTAWGALLHAALAALWIDRGHPYTFTSAGLHLLLARHGFRVLLEEIEDYAEVRLANRRSQRLRDKVKGYTGLSEFSHVALCSPDRPARHSPADDAEP